MGGRLRYPGGVHKAARGALLPICSSQHDLADGEKGAWKVAVAAALHLQPGTWTGPSADSGC